MPLPHPSRLLFQADFPSCHEANAKRPVISIRIAVVGPVLAAKQEHAPIGCGSFSDIVGATCAFVITFYFGPPKSTLSPCFPFVFGKVVYTRNQTVYMKAAANRTKVADNNPRDRTTRFLIKHVHEALDIPDRLIWITCIPERNREKPRPASKVIEPISVLLWGLPSPVCFPRPFLLLPIMIPEHRLYASPTVLLASRPCPSPFSVTSITSRICGHTRMLSKRPHVNSRNITRMSPIQPETKNDLTAMYAIRKVTRIAAAGLLARIAQIQIRTCYSFTSSTAIKCAGYREAAYRVLPLRLSQCHSNVYRYYDRSLCALRAPQIIVYSSRDTVASLQVSQLGVRRLSRVHTLGRETGIVNPHIWEFIPLWVIPLQAGERTISMFCGCFIAASYRHFEWRSYYAHKCRRRWFSGCFLAHNSFTGSIS